MAVDYVFILFFEFGIVMAGLVVALPLVKRYFARKTTVLSYLMGAGECQLLAALVTAFSRYLRMSGAWMLPDGKYLELLAITVDFLAAGNIFWLAFMLEVFYQGAMRGKNKFILMVYVYCVCAYSVYVFTTSLYIVDITVIDWVLLVCLGAPVSIALSISAWRLSRTIDNLVQKRCTQMIGVGPLFLLGCWGLFLVDRILGGNFTPLYYGAWVAAVIAIFAVYTGFIVPDWLKRRLSKSQPAAERAQPSAQEAVQKPAERLVWDSTANRFVFFILGGAFGIYSTFGPSLTAEATITTWTILALIGATVTFPIAFGAWYTSRAEGDLATKRGMHWISASPIVLFGGFLLLTNNWWLGENNLPLYIAGWCVVAIGEFLLHVGWLLPDWFKRFASRPGQAKK